MKWTIEKIKEEFGVDLSNDSRAKTRIQKECQMAKQLLQQEEYVCHEMQFDVLNQDLDLVELEITREDFERICQPIFDQCMAPVDLALNDAGLQKEQIDDIILVGGSTRILKLRQIL